MEGREKKKTNNQLYLRSKLPLFNDAFDLSIDRYRKG
jgi:hypothetical protein